MAIVIAISEKNLYINKFVEYQEIGDWFHPKKKKKKRNWRQRACLVRGFKYKILF